MATRKYKRMSCSEISLPSCQAFKRNMWASREREAHMYATLSRSLVVKVKLRDWHFEKCHASRYSKKLTVQYFRFID